MTDDILDSLGKLVRLANRIRNKYPNTISDFESNIIDNAMKVMRANSKTNTSQIPQHQVEKKSHVSTSLEGCPFHYCDSKPVCENKCRYNND